MKSQRLSDVPGNNNPLPVGSRPRVLSVLPDIPFPANTGLHLRMINNLDLIRRLGCESRILQFSTEERSLDDTARMELVTLCDDINFGGQRRPQGDFSIVSLVTHKADFLIQGGLGLRGRRYPFSMRYDAIDAERIILKEARDIKADYVVLPSFMVHYAGKLSAEGFCVIADAIDVLTDLTASLLAGYATAGRLGRLSLLANHWASRTQEKTYLPLCTEIWATTANEANALQQIAPHVNVVVVPNGMDERTVCPGRRVDTDSVGFIGTYSMRPNVEAACFLAEKVFPEVLRLRSNARLRIAGAHMPDDMASRLGRLAYVDLLGAVQNSSELFETCAVIALPVFIYGGTPLKLVEAMARGKAIVASSALAAKLSVSNGKDLLLRDDPASFASAIAALMADRKENERLGNNARETFLRIWSRENSEQVMRRSSILGKR